MKSLLVFLMAIVLMLMGFAVGITHILGLHQKFYSLAFFVVGAGLYQYAGLLRNRENGES